ncbi:PadR family transcriptional regulator [Streptomyces sp. S3(2020)]|nr:MarR family transcriptional regulator [Streptomyces sp. S3(2020)]NNN31886.1 PadR family transcriptional regulator [Streptomyces sp. S3(2020)]
MASIRLTRPTVEVIKVLLASPPEAPAWGLKICEAADLGSGTVYPILERLAKQGWITSFEETAPHPGRPARRYYELTAAGRIAVNSALEARRKRHASRWGLAGGEA